MLKDKWSPLQRSLKGKHLYGNFILSRLRLPCAALPLLVILTFMLCQGCARSVKVSYSDVAPASGSFDIFQTRVEVQTPPPAYNEEFVRSGFIAVGLYNEWNIDFAASLPQAVSDALKHSFATVSVHNGYRKGCDNCGIIVRPRITEFSVNALTMQSTIVIETRVFDAYNRPVATFTHKGTSPILTISRVGVVTAGIAVPFAGSALGNPVVNSTVKGALDEALTELKDRFRNEVKAGGQLARVWRPKKESYGEHEFLAEQVARKAGCDMNTDGVALANTQFGKEIYDAFCWRQGTFTITCELGHCEADLPPERAIVSQTNPVKGFN